MLKSLNKFKNQTIAIIPARGGSTRIKNKNLQKVGEHSLIRNSLIVCKNSGIFDEIIVSTDSSKIAEESREFSTMIHNRSKINSSATSSTESVISEVMTDFPGLLKNEPLIYLIQCTSPFLQEKDLRDSFKLIIDNNFDNNCLISGYFTNKFIWEKNLETNNWIPKNYDPTNRPRTQDKIPFFVENGAFYVFGASNFQLTNCRIHGKVAEFEMDEIRSIDIDLEKDLEFANFLTTFLKR